MIIKIIIEDNNKDNQLITSGRCNLNGNGYGNGNTDIDGKGYGKGNGYDDGLGFGYGYTYDDINHINQ